MIQESKFRMTLGNNKMKHKRNVTLAFAALALAIVPVLSAADTGGFFAMPVSASYEPSCASPTGDMIAGCAAQAERILASTVRLEIIGPSSTRKSHATVTGGRYLITHNHFSLVWVNVQQDDHWTIRLIRPDGRSFLNNMPLSIFTVVAETEEMLVLDFGEIDGIGFFERLGFSSAELKPWAGMPVQPGREVAQVNWDGSQSFVQWNRVSFIADNSKAPGLELEQTIMIGASGGGVFVDGIHIGNNWLKGTNYRYPSQSHSFGHSVAALNSEAILMIISPDEEAVLATQ